MRLIDGDRLMMSLADWWYSSFGEDETEESKAIHAVMDKVEKSLKHFEIAQPEHDCESCRYNSKEWYEEPCDSCTMGGSTNHWKPQMKEGQDENR